MTTSEYLIPTGGLVRYSGCLKYIRKAAFDTISKEAKPTRALYVVPGEAVLYFA